MNNQEPRTQNLEPSFDEPLVKVEGVSKKFCLSLKKSLWYGLCDMGRELTGRRHGSVRPITDTPHPELGSANQEQSTRNPELSGLRPKEFWAVHDVGFELRRGECLGLIGRNGAGKTTLLKMLNGLIKPDAGRIEMRGRVGALIALGAGFNPILTGRENVYVNASVLGLSRRETDRIFDEIVAFADIGDFLDTPVQNYSSGMVVRLGFAIASMVQPNVLLVDEVLAVGDVAFQSKCFNKLGELRRAGVSSIFVSHNMHHMRAFCDRAIYLSGGRIQYCGDVETAVASYQKDAVMRESAAAPAASDGAANGTGRVKILDISFRDERGRAVQEIAAREPLTLRIRYDAREDVDGAELDVVVAGVGSGLFFQASSEAFGKALHLPRGRGTIEIRFADLRANNQRLLFHLTLWARERTEVFGWRRNMPLFVDGDARCGGEVLLETDWRVAADAAARP